MSVIIISLGGSLIVPGHIDINFLKYFYRLINSQIKKGNRFVLICGGGKTARNYMNAASSITKLTRNDLDWLGIHSTRLNAHLLRTIFRETANKLVIKNPNQKINFKEKILIAAGWKPGFSTDYDAVILAKNLKAKTIINLSNISHVYDKDPNKHKDAKPIKQISWKRFRKMLPKKWDPGLNSPFDPIASRLAQKLKLKAVIMNGKNPRNLNNYLNNKKFTGTIINGR